MKKRSTLLIMATALATAYALYLISHFGGAVEGSSGAEKLGGAIATLLVMPHMAMFAVGAVFGWLGVFMKASWAALVAAILYAVGTVLFFLYAIFGIPILTLGFIGYSKQKKLNQAAAVSIVFPL